MKLTEDGSVKLDIPTVGFDGMVTSYFSAFHFVTQGNAVLQEGCKQVRKTLFATQGLANIHISQFKNRAFKVPLLDRWLVVVTGDHLYNCVRTAPDNILSSIEAMRDLLQIDYTLGYRDLDNAYHVDIIRTTLQKNLARLIPQMIDEAAHAFETEIGSKLEVDGRDREYCKLGIQFTSHVMTAAAIINFFPGALKPFVCAIYRKFFSHRKKMQKLLGPEIELRRKKYSKQSASYDEKPDDMLTWLMESAPSENDLTIGTLALRMLNLNFMTIFSTHISFTNAVYNLAAEPRYLCILRDEIQENLDLSGPGQPSTEDIERCIILDSFLKESLRINGLGAISLPRKAMVPFPLLDGTVIPPGTIISVSSTAAHFDSTRYERPQEFDGLRFAKLRQKEAISEKTDGHRLTSSGPGFLTFGSGKHIWWGLLTRLITVQDSEADLFTQPR
ncbi:hypothetical protein H0H81_001697 [Sphagnurus paluster]|uniref:Cytochrome P450 n=1 Tax=Sphagnurus paluster TaxID=117069 RepID=A0A9P7KLX8_9AGAR|nr:hypothetical protein H0H81_001697 [Sphagnurus paluster]